MTILYDPHLVERLKERRIPESWPREIIEQPSEQYYDMATRVYVSIGERWYKGKEREMVVSYVEEGSDYKAITIHPLEGNQKRNRINAGRWIRI